MTQFWLIIEVEDKHRGRVSSIRKHQPRVPDAIRIKKDIIYFFDPLDSWVWSIIRRMLKYWCSTNYAKTIIKKSSPKLYDQLSRYNILYS